YLPFVLYALGMLGEDGVGPDRVPLRLMSADLLGARRRRVYDGDVLAPPPYATPAAEHVAPACGGDVSLELLSPARIVYEGELARELPLHVVARSLLRRVTSLAYFHDDLALDLDAKGLIDIAAAVPTRETRLGWVDQRRHSARQGRTHVLGGAV